MERGEQSQIDISGQISQETGLDLIRSRLLDKPSDGVLAWLRTSTGMIAMLVFLQMVTGLLLAFHYVPAAGNAYLTVTYIQLAITDGSWIRSVHYHSSVLLPAALGLHLLQMAVRGAYRTNASAWIFGLTMLALVLVGGATGYALPWDARAINGVNVAASLAGHTPVIGETMRMWLLDGSRVSTLTLSRFYGLHAWIVPILIVLSATARMFIFGGPHSGSDRSAIAAWARQQFARNTIVAGVTFLGVSIFSNMFPAPLGPQLTNAGTYLSRPGPQFLWLFEMQKYTDGPLAAVLAMGFPVLVIGGLIALPLFVKGKVGLLRVAVSAVLCLGFVTVGGLTAAAIYQDKADPHIAEQVAQQERDEAEFRASPFEPEIQATGSASTHAVTASQDQTSIQISELSPVPVPPIYTINCAKCHGSSGEGTKKFPELAGVTTREEDPLTPEMVLSIINDPQAMGRSAKMPAYRNKLTEDEKQEIVAWIRTLSTVPALDEVRRTQTARTDINDK